jgi:hypothetical protein
MILSVGFQGLLSIRIRHHARASGNTTDASAKNCPWNADIEYEAAGIRRYRGCIVDIEIIIPVEKCFDILQRMGITTLLQGQHRLSGLLFFGRFSEVLKLLLVV